MEVLIRNSIAVVLLIAATLAAPNAWDMAKEDAQNAVESVTSASAVTSVSEPEPSGVPMRNGVPLPVPEILPVQWFVEHCHSVKSEMTSNRRVDEPHSSFQGEVRMDLSCDLLPHGPAQQFVIYSFLKPEIVDWLPENVVYRQQCESSAAYEYSAVSQVHLVMRCTVYPNWPGGFRDEDGI